MSVWSSYISQAEIETAARFLIEHHGDGAREEAIRLADIGRRLGSARNSALFRRAARYLASEHMTGAKAAPMSARRLGKIADLLFKFGSPRVAGETEARE